MIPVRLVEAYAGRDSRGIIFGILCKPADTFRLSIC